MAKPEARKVRFCNITVPSLLYAWFADEAPKMETDILLAFIELCSEGVKISFGYKEEQRAYSVAVTLPIASEGYDLQTASFWDRELFDALLGAYIAVFVFKANQRGFDVAGEAMKDREKKLIAEMKAAKP